MSTPNPELVAAAPALQAALGALSTFITNLGPDPTKLALTFPGALQVFVGTVELQFPTLVNAEFGVVTSDAQSKIAGLQAALTKATAPGS
jgi:hypothetical protein